MDEVNNTLEQPTKSKRTRWIVLAIIVAGFFVGCPLFYMSGSVDGRIIDAETGKPVANAHIVGVWELEGGIVDSAYLGPLYFEETISDENGNYHLNGFFIRFLPPNITFTRLHNMDPIIYIFSERHAPIGISGSGNRGKIYRTSSLNGMDIALQKMNGMTSLEYSSWHSSVSSMKGKLYMCDLAMMPLTVNFLWNMQKEFADTGVNISDYRLIYDSEFDNCK